MKKTINFIIDTIGKLCIVCMLASIIALFIMCFFTPEKTKSGQYTNAWQYWTSEEYFNNNF